MIRTLLRNPLTEYLRYLVQSTANMRRYDSFRQCYLADVVESVFEDHVTVAPHCVLRHCRFGRHSFVAEQSTIEFAYVGRFCSLGPACRIGLYEHPARTAVSSSPAFYSSKA